MIEPNVTLLLTHDAVLERQSNKVVSANGGKQVVARNADDVLDIVCARNCNIELALIDCDDGCRGLNMLSTLGMLCPGLPMIVVTSSNDPQMAALAYANGAAACVAKPLNTTELEILACALYGCKDHHEAA